jgi:hypothetical protein
MTTRSTRLNRFISRWQAAAIVAVLSVALAYFGMRLLMFVTNFGGVRDFHAEVQEHQEQDKFELEIMERKQAERRSEIEAIKRGYQSDAKAKAGK